ncbi:MULTISPECIES: hypothetical protein [Rossellomorea]|uniref:hypothetical protein n=1 Tax=Rossellomorea TaxID=2837508 RepID=UPI001CC9C64C|nr:MULTISPECIES: hypothetical protein [Rossellomorea]MCA0149461.1 hypothetical protein [Rossellomorea vietnamensis]WGG46732.1 hypothetical protein P8596_05785 [Rossellomorea sp. DA94]
MGKMKIHINCQINLSDEYENEPEKLQEEIDFILNKFGEVEELTKEQDENTITLKSQLKAHELQVNLFEKWGEWEYARNLSRDMRMNFIGFGEVEECNSGVFDYEATKKTFKNPLKSLLFFDK